MKTKKVTTEQMISIKSIIKRHDGDAYDYVEGIKEAAKYLKDNVEKPGLVEYINVTIGNVHSSGSERDICTDMFDEIAGFSKDLDSKAD